MMVVMAMMAETVEMGIEAQLQRSGLQRPKRPLERLLEGKAKIKARKKRREVVVAAMEVMVVMATTATATTTTTTM